MSEYINEPINITDIEDHEDGSATLKLELDPETYAAIFNAGFIHLVMKGIESEENND